VFKKKKAAPHISETDHGKDEKNLVPGEDSLETSRSGFKFGASRIISPIRILQGSLILLFLAVAIILAILPGKMQYAMVAAAPSLMAAIVILRNVFVGVYFYYLLEFLRPVDFIPALIPLKIVMVTELLTLVAWLFYLIKDQKKIKWDNFNNLYIAFISVMAITIVTAMNNRFAFNTTQMILVNFIIFLIATNVVDTKARLDKIIWLLLLIHLYHALKGIYNFAVLGFVSAGQHTSGRTGSGFIGDENDFALALNTMIPLAYFYFMSLRSGFKKYFSLFLVVVFVLGVVASNSRGGWVGLAMVILFCIIRSKRKLLSLAIISLLLMAGVMFAPPDFWQQVESISDTNEATAQTRLHYWGAAARMLIANPIVGVGAGNGPLRMPEYVQGFRSSATQWGRTFHGTIPQVMAELGLLGIGLYLIMVIYALRVLLKVKKRSLYDHDEQLGATADGLTGAMVGYLACATFLSTAYYPQLWTLFVLIIILKYIPGKDESFATS
jgi:putative inorganic carbon (hco3(-)) transporter